MMEEFDLDDIIDEAVIRCPNCGKTFTDSQKFQEHLRGSPCANDDLGNSFVGMAGFEEYMKCAVKSATLMGLERVYSDFCQMRIDAKSRNIFLSSNSLKFFSRYLRLFTSSSLSRFNVLLSV